MIRSDLSEWQGAELCTKDSDGNWKAVSMSNTPKYFSPYATQPIEQRELHDKPVKYRLTIDKTKYKFSIPRETETEESVDIVIEPKESE